MFNFYMHPSKLKMMKVFDGKIMFLAFGHHKYEIIFKKFPNKTKKKWRKSYI